MRDSVGDSIREVADTLIITHRCCAEARGLTPSRVIRSTSPGPRKYERLDLPSKSNQPTMAFEGNNGIMNGYAWVLACLGNELITGYKEKRREANSRRSQ